MNAITANEIQMGIEHAALVIAQWDAACEDETVATDADVAAAQERVAKMFAEINAMTTKEVTKPAKRKMSSVEASMPAWMLTGRTTNGTFSGRGTEKPAAQKAAAPQIVEQVQEVIWDDEFDAPYVAPNEELSDETLALIAADTTPLNLDEPLALEQPPVWMQPENATEAEPGPIEEPVALRPVRPEQKAYFVKFVLNSDQSKKYAMLFRKSDGLAVGCECKSRKFHHGVACKHMTAHNAMLAKPAQKATQAA